MNRDMKEMFGFVRTPQFLMSYHAPPTHHNNNNISPQQKYVVFRENTFWEKNGPINGNKGHKESSVLITWDMLSTLQASEWWYWLVAWSLFLNFETPDCKQHFKFLGVQVGVRSAEQWAEAHQRRRPLQLRQKPEVFKAPIKSVQH